MKLRQIHNLVLNLLIFLIGVSCSEDDHSVDPVLQVSISSIEFSPEGQTATIEIVANGPWSFEPVADWIEITPKSGQGNGTVTLKALPNNTGNDRHQKAIVRLGTISKEVQLGQKMLVDEFYIVPDPTGMRNISSLELVKEFGLGWNLGNSLEAIGGETAWGNPPASQELIDKVKAAGFNAVRIPVAWSKFSDPSNYTIEQRWMLRVEEVVNYVLSAGMYAIINIHWDGGWIQPTYSEEEAVNNRLNLMWRQIALHFRDYNDHLLFAGTNEVMVTGDYGTPTQEYYTVQNGFNQTFVNTVRATGGRNAFRHLVYQAFNTNIDFAVNFSTLPSDSVKDKLVMEVHYYDPFQFALDENSNVSQWGKQAIDPSRTSGWGDESHADSQFQKIKANFIDKGTPVIMGEYGAISKNAFPEHEGYREYYVEYITKSMINRGIIPFYWDNGWLGNHGFGVFERNSGQQAYPKIVEAIMKSKDLRSN